MKVNVRPVMLIHQNTSQQAMCISVIFATKIMITIIRGGRVSESYNRNYHKENDDNDGRPLIHVLYDHNKWVLKIQIRKRINSQ